MLFLRMILLAVSLGLWCVLYFLRQSNNIYLPDRIKARTLALDGYVIGMIVGCLLMAMAYHLI